MKKVLILGNHAEGLYNFRKELIQKLVYEQYEVHYSVPPHKKVDLLKKIGGVYHSAEINRRGINPVEDLKLIKYYDALIKKVDPEVILTYTIKCNIYGGITAAIHKKPAIANITGLGSSLKGNSFFSKIVRQLYKYSLRKAHHVFFQNQGNLDYFLRYKMIPEHRASLIPGSGVNIQHFHVSTKNSSDESIIFLFIARIMKEKGIDEYTKSAQQIKIKYKNTEFQVLGFIEEVRYKSIIKDMDHKGIINYLGHSLDVRNEIKNADCIVLPSYYPEGMSNVLLEGAAMGKALITTDMNGCKEIVDDGINGFICKPKDTESLIEALTKFIHLPIEQRRKMGLNSREKIVKEFDRNIVIDQYMKIIESIIKRR